MSCSDRAAFKFVSHFHSFCQCRNKIAWNGKGYYKLGISLPAISHQHPCFFLTSSKNQAIFFKKYRESRIKIDRRIYSLSKNFNKASTYFFQLEEFLIFYQASPIIFCWYWMKLLKFVSLNCKTMIHSIGNFLSAADKKFGYFRFPSQHFRDWKQEAPVSTKPGLVHQSQHQDNSCRATRPSR